MTATNSDEFPALARRYECWLMEKALPLWADKGVDRLSGGFFDLVDLAGEPVHGPKRGRVQGRQSWVFAVSGTMGWHGPWAKIAGDGLDFALAHRRADGQLCTLMAADGKVLDETAMLYDQTFFLLALAETLKHFPARKDLREAANRLHGAILARRHVPGGFVESGSQPFQSNAHMHLLEAALAWAEIEPGGLWDELADEVAGLGISRLRDENGAIREFYDPDWRPLAGPSGRSVEPGHQFEWAWLLLRWAQRRANAEAEKAARRLFEIGASGTDPARNVAMDELDDQFRVVRPTARLWPQTERIKSALALMTASQGSAHATYRAQAFAGAISLWRYLETPIQGLWRDRMLADGSFADEASPASSFYHIICCIKVMLDSIGADSL